MNTTQVLGLIPMVPLLAVPAIYATARWPNVREAVSVSTGLILLGLVVTLVWQVGPQSAPALVLAEPLPGLALALSPEPLGMLFALVASFLWPVTTLYAIGYMRAHHEENQTRFYIAFAVSIAATMGIALSANMLTLFLFYELLTLATYPLVTHAGDDDARRGGRVYLGLLLSTSIFFLLLARRFELRGKLSAADRLDRLALAIEGYASPELTLDALLLTWPRPSSDRSVAA